MYVFLLVFLFVFVLVLVLVTEALGVACLVSVGSSRYVFGAVEPLVPSVGAVLIDKHRCASFHS